MTRLYLRQADPKWSGLQLGFGLSTFGGAGCVMFSLLAAAHELGTRPPTFGPRDANELFKQAGAFRLPDGTVGGSNLAIHIAASALGLEAPYEARAVGAAGDPALVDAVERALERGLAIVHVDHDRARPNGDREPDHFILAVGFEQLEGGALELACMDSAPRAESDRRVRLAWPELAGRVLWRPGVERDYAARGVRPIRRL